jgi:hypothetical protein
LTGDRRLRCRTRALARRPNLPSSLNRRLAAPAPEPLPRAPAHHHRLRLVLFLAAAAGLHQATTACLRRWAGRGSPKPPEQQTALLWRAWLDAAPRLRQQYAFADALIPRPWPTPLLHALQATPAQSTRPQPTWPSTCSSKRTCPIHSGCIRWTSLTAQCTGSSPRCSISQALLPIWRWLSVTTTRAAPRFSLSALGRFLLGVDQEPRPLWQPEPPPATADAPDEYSDSAAYSIHSPTLSSTDDGWRIELSPATPRHLQAALTAYAAHIATTGAPPYVVQHYALNHATLARAIAAGFGWPQLASTLEQLSFSLISPPCRQLADHFTQIPVITLQTHTLLHTADRATLQALLADPALRPLIDDLLAATTATLHAEPDVISQRLQASGYAVRANTRQPSEASPPASAALWLAGTLYRRLADFLALPLPLLPAQLDTLLADLSPIQCSILTAYRSRLEAALLDLLEGRIYAPPTFTVDVLAHRQRLEAAAAAHRPVVINYFSPGRNLLTRRPIQPYWIETSGSHRYLRAECLLSGRVLIFRLDRIQAIEEGE